MLVKDSSGVSKADSVKPQAPPPPPPPPPKPPEQNTATTTERSAKILDLRIEKLTRIEQIHNRAVNAVPQSAPAAPAVTPSPPVDPNGAAQDARSGAEAAARLNNPENYKDLPGGRDQAANDYAVAVDRHKNDPAYLADLYKGLGAERAAELTASASAQGKAYAWGDNNLGNANEVDSRQALATAFNTVGSRLPASFVKDFGEAAAKDVQSAASTALVLRGVDQNKAGNLQRSFTESVMRNDRALNVDDKSKDALQGYTYARAAGEVLANNDALRHEYLGANGRLSPAERGAFMDNALQLASPNFPNAESTSMDGFERAIGKLQPADLQDVLQKNPAQVKQMVENFSGDAYRDNAALGNLLKNASQIRVDGKISDEALNLFAASVDKVGVNNMAREGAGKFFVDNARAVVDKYADEFHGDDAHNPFAVEGKADDRDVLRKFFANVAFSPQADKLQYSDGTTSTSLAEKIVGKDGALSQVTNDLIAEAKDQQTAGQPGYHDTNDINNYSANGKKIGSLVGAMQAGIIDGAQDMKDYAERNKALQAKIAGYARDGIASIASKFVPDKAVEIGKTLYDKAYEYADKKWYKPWEDKREELQKASAAFETEFNDVVAAASHQPGYTQELHDGYSNGHSDYMVHYLQEAQWDD